MNYSDFLQTKEWRNEQAGFKPLWMPDFLFDFQKDLTEWAIRKGRAAIFADCGLGKSVMEFVWALNVAKKTNGRVLLVTPIAVGAQMIAEAEKFDIDGVHRSRDGKLKGRIIVTNYERLHYFRPEDFAGFAGDESSVLKCFNSKTKNAVNQFVRKIRYRLLATATPAPNDFVELGTTSEALGYLGHVDMLTKFFQNQNSTIDTKGHWRGFHASRMYERKQWNLKGYAQDAFWRWVTSWARSIRKPSDLGYDNGKFKLPKLVEQDHELQITRKKKGTLFVLPAVGLKEVRDERKDTIKARCEKVAELVNADKGFAVVWCNLNPEGDLLEKLIDGAVQVSGKDSDDEKERKLTEFTQRKCRVLVTKPKIGAWGLNWQHCSHVTYFPNYSYEQYYQGVRRCWRFGQTKPVTVDRIFTRGDRNSIRNLQRKAAQADEMFTKIVREMNHSLEVSSQTDFPERTDKPSWV